MAQTAAQLLIDVESLKNMLMSRATGGVCDNYEYKEMRRALTTNPLIRDKLPRFIHTCRNPDEFWSFIKPKFSTYAQRREYLRVEFDAVLSVLENHSATPSDESASDVLTKVDSEHVREAWTKALERRTSDPDGAITAARTLLESVCKHILDEKGITYDDKEDIPDLYDKVAKHLNLSPSQHTEKIFKQILGNCQAVVGGLGAMRNRLSDAHGKGKISAKPATRHAELAVNLAGTMATFLLATWQDRKGTGRLL